MSKLSPPVSQAIEAPPLGHTKGTLQSCSIDLLVFEKDEG